MNDLVKSEPKNEIVVYQPNETMRLEVRIENDTACLSRQQMARLFGRDVKTIGKHVANALKEELAPLVAKSATSDVIPTARSSPQRSRTMQRNIRRCRSL